MRVLVTATLLMTLALAGEARADSVTINAYTTAGQPDAVSGVARVWSISGQASRPTGLMIKFRPVGGQPCAPTAQTDTGEYLDGYETGYADYRYVPRTTVDGKFDKRSAYAWQTPGTYQFCYWLSDRSTDIVTPITQTIVIRSPVGSITSTFTPVSPLPGQTTTLGITGSSEAPKKVYAKLREAGLPCSPTFSSDPGDSLVNGESVVGQFSVTATTSREAPGNYVVCLWLADSDTDAQPVAGPQPQPLTVLQPTPVVTSGRVVNCRNGLRMTRVRVRTGPSLCASYTFSTEPRVGAAVTASFVRPNGKTHSVKRAVWDDDQTQPLRLGSLPKSAYRSRRGLWRVVLRVDGREIHRASFRAVR